MFMDSQATSTVTPESAQPAVITTLLRAISVPAIGTHWIEQGGVFAGIVKAPEGDCALIVAVEERGHFEDRTWGEWDKSVEGADSFFDGRANTRAMAAADCALAKDIQALDIAGLTDWYLPAQGELQIARANVTSLFDKADWYWTSTQYSPHNAWVQDFERRRQRRRLQGLRAPRCGRPQIGPLSLRSFNHAPGPGSLYRRRA
jgi:hypothetical protein